MVGITAYGAYVPYFRLSRAEIAKAWKGGAGSGEKAVANMDEDSITMAVAAGTDCLHGTAPQKLDGLYLATTTCPYRERQGAGIVASALDLRPDVRVADFTDSLRVGATALANALDAVKAGSAGSLMVAIADSRAAATTGEDESAFGDGAAAFIVGSNGVIAALEGQHSIMRDVVDVWRTQNEEFSRTWEGRWVRDEGYMRAMPEVVAGLLAKLKLTPKDITKVALYGPEDRTHAAVGKAMGFEPGQIQDPLYKNVGNTGTALAPMILVSILEEAKPGDRIMLVSYGNGAEAMLFKVTDEIKNVQKRRAIKGHLAVKRAISYEKYITWKGLVPLPLGGRGEAAAPVSMSALWRNYDQVIPLYGSKCTKCGTPQYPPQRVCAQCLVTDQMEPYRFADKKAKIFTFTHDLLSFSPDPPNTIAVIDFDGGGRGCFNVTDRDPDEIKWDMPVEMTFRRQSVSKAFFHYFWKAKPAR